MGPGVVTVLPDGGADALRERINFSARVGDPLPGRAARDSLPDTIARSGIGTGIQLPEAIAGQFAAVAGVAASADWAPAREVIDGQLPDLIDRFMTDRGTGTRAVAGSLLVLDYARKLCWPVLGAHLRSGSWLDPSWSNVYLSAGTSGSIQVAFRAGPTTMPELSTAEILTSLISGHLDHLVQGVRRVTRVGARTLWGNVAVAVSQVFMAYSWASGERARFLDLGRRELNANRHLRSLVSLETVAHEGDDWMVVWRRTCCLAFRGVERRAPYCGTCCVVDHADRVDSFHRAAARYVQLE